MKQLLITMSAVAALGLPALAQAAVSNTAWLQGTSLDGGSTDLRGTNPKLISWSAHSSIDPTAFKHSLVDATQLTVTKDGDYFVAATLPMQGAAVRSVDTLEVFVNDEAVPGAISRCTYIRNADGHSESSAHIAQLIPGLKANDVITVKTYRGSTENTRTDMGTASLFVEWLDDGRNVFGSTSAGTGNDNLNRAAGEEDMYLKWDGVGREGSAFSAADSAITLKDQGSYLVTVNVPLQGNVARASVGLSLLLGDPEDGEWAIGGLAQQGYIRNANGHNKASIHFSGVVNTAEVNTDLTIYLEQRAAAGNVTLGGKLASIFIEKISTDGLFHATATQMFNGETWSPANKDQVYWEEEDRVIDSNTFGHGGDDLQNIVIKKAGSYLLAYNDVLEGGNARANPRITVEVNGAEVPGAQTKSHYNSHANDHDEVSGSMVVLLENLAADDVVTVSAQQEGSGGPVTAAEPALLSLIQKDNLSLPAGDQSPPRFSSFSGGLDGFSAIVEDFRLKLDAATLKATLNGEVVDVTVDSANGVNSISYAFATFPSSGSEHALNIAFNDTGGNAHSMDFAFTVTAEYQTVSSAFSMSDVNKDKGGFRVNMTQISTIQTEGPNNVHNNLWANAEKQLRGEFLNPNEVDDDDNPLPYLNEADPDAEEGWSIAPADVDYVNMNQDEDDSIGNFGEDQMFPNIPGWGDSTDGIAGEFLTVLHLKKGFHTLGVNSDDGFSATIGINFPEGIETKQIGLFDGGRGAADSLFNIAIEEEGYYPFRVSWWEGGGGANIEIFSIVDGVKVLINDPDNENAIKAYNIGNSTGRTYLGSVSPAPDDTFATENSISATIIEDGTKAKSGSIKVLFNGEEVDASIKSTDGVITVTAEPDGGIGIGSHTAKIVFTETTNPETERSFDWSFEVEAIGPITLLAYWDFNDVSDPAQSVDAISGLVGVFEGAFYSADAEGFTGAAGDYALDLGDDQAGQLMRITSGFLNTAEPNNQITVVFRQKLDVVNDAMMFHGVSSSSNANERGISAHAPWSNNNIYFDTAGCCEPGTQRINAPIGNLGDPDFSFLDWHTYTFVKDGDVKQIWIDDKLFHQGVNTAPLPSDFTQFVVGAFADGLNSMSGLVDDVAVYAGALAVSHIEAIAAGGLPKADTTLNLVTIPGVVVSSSSYYELEGGFPPSRAIDGNLDTSWFAAEQDAANLGTTPYVELLFPRRGLVTQVNIRGNRQWADDYDIFAGRIDLFGDDGEILFTADVDLTGLFGDVDFKLPTPQPNVRTVRFTSTSDESIEPGFAELEVWGNFHHGFDPQVPKWDKANPPAPKLTLSEEDMKYGAQAVSISADGDMADWADLEFKSKIPFEKGGELVLFEEYGGGTWSGPADHSSAVAFAWDAENLYVGVVVTDDTHQNPGNGWNGDSIQMVFANAAQDTVTHLYNYGLSDGGDVVIHNEKGPGGTVASITRDDDTTTTLYELKYPAASLGLDAFEGGMSIGIGVCVNDGDTQDGQGGQKGWSGWGPYAAVYGKTASATGLVSLVIPNLSAKPGVVVSSSSSYAGYPASRAIDGNLATSWFAADNDAANLGTTPYVEVVLPSLATVNQVNIRGNREWPGYDIFAGRIDLFGDDGEILFTTDVEKTGQFYDVDFVLPKPQADVRTVRFTSTSDESIEPGFAELEVFGIFQGAVPPPEPSPNLSAKPGVVVSSSSSYDGYPASRAIDGNLATSWFAADNDAANLGTTPYVEVVLPKLATVNQVNIRGNREWPDYDIFAGRIDLFGDDGEILFTADVEKTGQFYDVDFVLPTPQADVRTVRFTSTDDESIEPGLAELEVFGAFQDEVPPAPPTLSIVNNGDGTVTVTFEGKLQAAASVNGPWEDVEGATSPLTLQPDQSATFARAVK